MAQGYEYGGWIYEPQGDGRYRRTRRADMPDPSQPTVTQLPQSPQQMADEARKQQDQQFEAQRLGIEQERLRLAQQEAARQSVVQNPAADRLKDAQTLRMLVDEYERVAQPYMGTTTGGEVWAQVNPFDRLNTEGMRARETTAQNILPLIRRLMRTPGDPQAQLETSAYDSYLPSITATDDENRRRVRMLREMADKIDPAGATRQQRDQEDQLPPGVAGPAGGTGYGGPNPRPPVFSPGDPQYDPSQGTRTENDPRMAAIGAEYRQRLGSGQSSQEIIQWLGQQGVGPQTMMQAIEQLKYREQHPEVPADRYSITSNREVPLSLYEQAVTGVGSGPAGAYAIGAGSFLSGNTLDNMAGDPERARLAMQLSQAQNPNAYAAGELSGGVLASLGGEAALARLGMAPGFLRGLLADTSMGAATGAGAADSGNRAAGALGGALTAGAGSAGGSLAMRGLGGVISPKGGVMADLYQSGVRPTPGQRFANSGVAGRILNTTEEALQSVPGVGQAIRGARQQARDQFQVGAFNEALQEVGEQLPKGMKPGTDPHTYAQNVFKRVYAEARSGMTMVADEQLSSDIASIADIATLGPVSQKKLKAIWQNAVNNRLVNGVMDGKGYKQAISDLGRHIARQGKSLNADDQQLGEVLQSVRAALEASARRHSDPAAVQLLDAADAGYAKFVRIEEAAARRGGDAGTFSPTNFDSAVQRASGGVRSKSYLRGDALMQDYAQAGKGLDDTLPNSGSADRIMAGYAVGAPAAGAAVWANPKVAAVLGTIGMLYAPGVRRATTGAFAPRGPKAKAIAAQLAKRARLAGAIGASGALALPGTYPGQ